MRKTSKIADTRSKLELYAAQGHFAGGRAAALVGELERGGAAAIAAGETDARASAYAPEAIDEAQERSSFDSGTD